MAKEQAAEITLHVKLGAAFGLAAGMLFGYDLTVISGASLFIKQDFSLTPALLEVVISAHIVGALAAAPFGGVFCDRIGRRRVLILTGLVSCFGAIATGLATDTWTLLAGRFIVGAGITVASIGAPLYVGEIAPAQQRGYLVSLYTVGLSVGVLTGYSADYLFAAMREWQWMLGLGAVPALLLTVGFYLLPETPRWLSRQGRTDDARAAIQLLYGRAAVDDGVADLTANPAQRDGSSWSDLLAPTFRRALFLGTGISVFRSITGFVLIRLYGPEILEAAGFADASKAIGATVLVGILMIITTFAGSKLVDRSGRRPLLLIGFLGMGASMLALGFVVRAVGLEPDTPKWTGLLCILSFTAFFGLGPAAAYRVVITEIFPTSIRGRAGSVCSIANNLANLVVAGSFLTLSQAIGQGETFWLYSAAGLSALAFVYFLLPETKGRTLEEIAAYWQKETDRPPPAVGIELEKGA